MSKKLNIAVFCVATGGYSKYIPALWGSALRHFLPGHNRYLILATDDPDISSHEEDILPVLTRHEQWPFPTLMRYNLLVQNSALFTSFDYVYMIDADMRFVGDVGDEVLGKLVAVDHPGFAGNPVSAMTFETRACSTAAVSPTVGSKYYAGAFGGGETASYLLAATTIAANVQEDLRNNIIARWHDESHWNRYLSDNPPTITLGWEFCFPQSAFNAPVDETRAKIVALFKEGKAT